MEDDALAGVLSENVTYRCIQFYFKEFFLFIAYRMNTKLKSLIFANLFPGTWSKINDSQQIQTF